MSNRAAKPDLEKDDGQPDFQYDGPEPKGPNLLVLYGFLALGLLVAMGFAAMVVYPFYLRH